MAAQRVIEWAFAFSHAKTGQVAAESFGEVAKRFSCKTVSVESLQHEVVVVFLCVIGNQSIPENGDKVDSVRVIVELFQQFPHILQTLFSSTQNLLDADDIQFHSSFLSEPFCEMWGKFCLLLDVYAAEAIEEFVLLVAFDDVDEDAGEAGRAESARKAHEEVTVLAHFEAVFKQESGLVLDVLEETGLADGLTLVQQNGSAITFVLLAHLPHSFNFRLRLRFALTIRALLLGYALLHLLLPLNDSVDLLFYLLVFVLVPSAGQFIVEVHVVVFLLQRMGNSSAKLLLIGLDNAGKSTILARIMEPGENASGITPTIGYKKDKFTRNGVDFEVLDMSGEKKYRDLWQSNAATIDEKDKISGIIFVVDSSDKMRIRVAKSELELILENRGISSLIPFLFFANKADVKGATQLEEVQEILDLKNLRREYQIFSCSGTTGKGVQEGIDWLCGLVKIKLEASR